MFAVFLINQGTHAFFRCALCISFVDLQQVHYDSTHGGEVLGGVALVGLIVIFAKRCVQYPVTAVFDAPVLADVVLLLSGTAFEAADLVANFPCFFGVIQFAAATFHHDQAAELRPFVSDFLGHPIEAMVYDGVALDDPSV